MKKKRKTQEIVVATVFAVENRLVTRRRVKESINAKKITNIVAGIYCPTLKYLHLKRNEV